MDELGFATLIFHQKRFKTRRIQIQNQRNKNSISNTAMFGISHHFSCHTLPASETMQCEWISSKQIIVSLQMVFCVFHCHCGAVDVACYVFEEHFMWKICRFRNLKHEESIIAPNKHYILRNNIWFIYCDWFIRQQISIFSWRKF